MILLGQWTIGNDLLQNSSFWTTLQDIKTIIDKLEVTDSKRTIDLLSSNSSLVSIKSYALPSENFTIDFCYTLTPSGILEYDNIYITYLADINVYLHFPNQFLYVWKNKINMMTTTTPLNVKTNLRRSTINIYNTNVNFMIEKHNLVKEELEIYDECILHLQIDRNTTMGDIVGNKSLSTSKSVQLKFKEMSNEILEKITKSGCPDPKDYAIVTMMPTKLTKYTRINKLVTFVKTFGTGLDIQNLKTKPMLKLNIPKFTKIVKVLMILLKNHF